MKWTQVQLTSQGLGADVPIPTYETTLGKDPEGNTWLCRVKFDVFVRQQWMVMFDTNQDEPDTPFLREEVVYADNFWAAHVKRYHTRYDSNYQHIGAIIDSFIEEHQIIGERD